MRKILSTAALTLAVGLAGPTPSALASPSASPGFDDDRVFVASCVITNDCVIPEPDPGITLNPNIPSGPGGLTGEQDDEDLCELLGICPEIDPELNPDIPAFPGGLTHDQGDPCEDLLEPCPGGDDDDDGDDTDDDDNDGDDNDGDDNDGDDSDDEDTDDGDDNDEDDSDDEDTDDGEEEEEEDTDDGGVDENDDADEPGDSTADIDTPRPGDPTFTG